MEKARKACTEKIWVITPFERPDVKLAEAANKAGAFPILHLGRNYAEAKAALGKLDGLNGLFGVCMADKTLWDLSMPNRVSKLILPWGAKPPENVNTEIVWQVCSEEETEEAIKADAKTLILKGSEGAGFCGEESAFILFQKIIGKCQIADIDVFVQGGIGVHSAAAYTALGAAGVVLDSQAALFPECSLSQAHKTALGRLTGNEIRVCAGFRYYAFPKPDTAGDIAGPDALFERIGAAESDILPLGQDIVLAADLADEYRRLRHLVKALEQSASSHVKQAMIKDAFAPGGESAETLGTVYAIAQGPMARVSDEPGFLRSVADNGALPFFAMGMMTGETAESALGGAAAAMEGKPWGVGILGFTYPKTLEEQTKIILKIKPPFVLIAGGRPDQAKAFEREGIRVLLHAPTPGLLDMFLKEGARAFIFEGRESGGHVGPLFSAVLWEKQINRLLKTENLAALSEMCVFFAGGIHDALSSAFIRVMAGPLTARGVKVCVQCGTAYLCTEEAVRHGAISETYQKLLIEKDRTVLLRFGSGQETRCLPSPYAGFFLKEKSRMANEGLDSGEILLKLEALNLGRARIASKGLERAGGRLVPLSETEQLEKGLFMAGDIAALINKTKTIAELHKNLTVDSLKLISDIGITEPANKRLSPSDVAVIGMAGIFPGAADVDEFWRNIVFGREYITEVPPERWPADLYYSPDGKDTDYSISKWGGFIDKTDFNALEFGITPQSLSAIESIQLISLLIAKRALEDAGFTDFAEADFDDTAVIFGTEGGGDLSSDYAARVFLRGINNGEMPEGADKSFRRLTEDSFPGVLGNVIAGRISNRLNTGGRNFTVDAACASSLAALDIAVTELNTGKAGMVILGGADLNNGLMPFLLFSSTHALSPSGRCATFDMDADGIAISEGIGVLILKRLEDAERDGHRIYAVIKGTGGSSDGKNLGLTAPNRRGQMRALEQAHERAGVRPSEVGLIESHGTGTGVGDRVELRALTDVFLNDGVKPGQTALGSLKSQIGHTKAAAGAAGLIKVVNCVRHGILPRTYNLKRPNEVYTKASPFAFRTEKAGYWRGERRIAGLSGFGFGGTNFHAVVENYDPGRPEAPFKTWMSELFVFPGETAQDAESLMGKVTELLEANDRLKLRDIAYSLAAGYAGRPIQYAIVARSKAELLARMDKAREGSEDEYVYRLKPVEGKVAFLFPGQGSQRINMASDLFIVFPRMRRLLAELPEYERILFPETVFTDAGKTEQNNRITDTRNAQPLLGIVDFAIAGLLRDFGLEPDMAAGHSYGELPALCFAGAFDSKDLAGLSRARADAILAAATGEPGRMAAAFTDAKTLAGLLDNIDDVWAVNFNAPRQTAVAGTDAGMGAFLKKAGEAGVVCKELKVARAFHSPLLNGADKGFAAALNEIGFNAPEIPVWSNTDAGLYPLTGSEIKERLAAHLVNPVRFTEEIENMRKAGASVFIEAGPGGTLCKLAGDILKDDKISIIQTERGGEDGLTFFLQALAKYISTGRRINMDKLFEGREAAALNINEPALYKKTGIIWNVSGQAAAPENEEGPVYSRYLLNNGALRPLNVNNGGTEQIMMAYLDNIYAMIQDQRDVMLGYFGAEDMTPRVRPERRLSTAPYTETQPRVDEQAEANGAPSVGAADDGLLDISAITHEQITNIIFETVSEKTGYPVDMLNPDMDLEADLSIDSIKKMEIIGGLRSRIRLPENDDNMDAFFERIISVKKFRDLTAWIEEVGQIAAAGGNKEYNETRPEAGAGGKQAESAEMVRMTFVKTARPIEKTDAGLIAGKTFAVTEDGNGLAGNIAGSLKAMGAEARIIDINAGDLSDIDGLILINSSAGVQKYTVKDMFVLLKRARMDKLEWALAFDDVSVSIRGSGAAGSGVQTGVPVLPEGFPGFLKTLVHEYPGKRFSAVMSETIFDPETFAGMVINELTTGDHIPEVFYGGNERFLMLPEINAVKTDGGATPLDENSTVLVLGGAQGITPRIIARMAKDMPCRYILIGRSAQDPESGRYAEFKTVEEVRRFLIGQGEIKNPREIEDKARRVFKSSRIAASVALIGQAGGKAGYISADVTDNEAFDAVIMKIKEQYGGIDGVIHAAGILEDKLFRSKDIESFARVYDTKAIPLNTVINKLLPGLKLLVLFSSSAASFGNAGQCDYAAGNSVLDSAARILKQYYPALRVCAFNWGPWKGAGMVSDSLASEFGKKGISLIEPDKGCEFFVSELIYGAQTNVVAIAGDEQNISDFIKTI